MTRPAITLLLPENADDPRRAQFLGPRWRDRWAAVHDGPAAALAERFAPFVRLRPGEALPAVEGVTLGLWITETEQLEALDGADGAWLGVVFEPSLLAHLDSVRAERPTLVAARRLQQGRAIGSDDMATVPGGGGLNAALKERVVGLKALYDLEEGAPITFGVIA